MNRLCLATLIICLSTVAPAQVRIPDPLNPDPI